MAVELTKEEEKEDWYAVLGLEVDATESKINKAFRSLSLRWHPDKNGGSQEAHDMFMRVKEAKLFLMDGKKRKVYDEKRAARKKMENLMVSGCALVSYKDPSPETFFFTRIVAQELAFYGQRGCQKRLARNTVRQLLPPVQEDTA